MKDNWRLHQCLTFWDQSQVWLLEHELSQRMNIYHKLSTNDLKDVFSKLTSKKVAVIGDFCLDAYWFINSNFNALSLETGLPVNHVEKQNYFPGGAANIVNNLKSLGVGNVDVYGVIGNDPFGNELSRQLNQINCNTKNLLIQNIYWNTHTYSKPILNGNEINRIDFGVNNSLQNDTEDKLIDSLKKNINDYDLAIINQQITKGLHQNSFPTKLQEVIDATNVDFISDCRNKEVEYSNSFLKTNIHEAIQKGLFIDGDSDQPIIKKKIDEGFYKKIVISRESKGCLVFSEKEIIEIPVPRNIKPQDTVGGGDSLLTGISIGLISGCDMIQSTLIGCLSAFVTIQKPFQTGTVNPDEIMLSLKQIINQ